MCSNLTVFDKAKFERAYETADSEFHEFIKDHQWYREHADEEKIESMIFEDGPDEKSDLTAHFPFMTHAQLPLYTTAGREETMDKSTVPTKNLATRPGGRLWESWISDRVLFSKSPEKLSERVREWEETHPVHLTEMDLGSPLVWDFPSVDELQETLRTRYVLAARLSMLALDADAADAGKSGGVASVVGHGRET